MGGFDTKRTMIGAIVLVVAGTMFAIMVGGLFLPIYDLVSKVSGR